MRKDRPLSIEFGFNKTTGERHPNTIRVQQHLDENQRRREFTILSSSFLTKEETWGEEFLGRKFPSIFLSLAQIKEPPGNSSF